VNDLQRKRWKSSFEQKLESLCFSSPSNSPCDLLLIAVHKYLCYISAQTTNQSIGVAKFYLHYYRINKQRKLCWERGSN